MRFRRLAVAFSLSMALAVGSSTVQAQEAGREIGSTPKGTIGLGLVGAEIGFVVPALAGWHEAWAFAVFPTVGAAGGAIAGYYLLDRPDRSRWSVAMLVTGMALVLPAMVVTLWATAYDPEREADVIRTDEGIGVRAGRDGDRSSHAERATKLRRAGTGVFRRSELGWLLGVPAPEVVSAYPLEDRLRYRLAFEPEVHVPLVTGSF